MPISVSCNVTLLDKKRFFKGKKGTYVDLVLWETPDSEYGDYLVKQKCDKGEKLPILGNAKNFAMKGIKNKAQNQDNEDDDDDQEIPF
jgi:hypothetical protein